MFVEIENSPSRLGPDEANIRDERVRRHEGEPIGQWRERLERMASERGVSVVTLGAQNPARPPPPRTFGLVTVRKAAPRNQASGPPVGDL